MKLAHLKLESESGAKINLDALYQICPACFTETRDAVTGELRHTVNFTTLRQLLGDDAVEDTPEAYEFNWVGKQEARREVARPIMKTLRPAKEDSVDWDNTQNLYIEGDNLEALKLLQKSYLGKVKMIYIDPPYNTGNDFVYDDDFAATKQEDDLAAGNVDELGNRFRKNTDTNGRFHSDWCSMIYSRLLLARTLLTEDGVIFISIGQDELDNLNKIAGEIFGGSNKISVVSRVMKSGGAKGQFFSPNVEYLLVYAKNIEKTGSFREAISEEIIKKLYTSIQTSGKKIGQKYRPFGLYQSSLDERPNQRFFIECPDGTFVIPPGSTMPKNNSDAAFVLPNKGDGCWRWSRERYIEERQKGNIEFKKSNGVLIDQNGEPAKWNVYSKIWLSDRQEDGVTPVDLITKWENRHSSKELQELGISFDFAKPVGLLKYLISLQETDKKAIILDFFSGSATTAHAVMQLNSEDKGNRKFIMVQLPEETSEDSEAYKAGYKNICEIGKERIRRAGKKIKDELAVKLKKERAADGMFADESKKPQNLDTGFRVFRIDDSNMKDVYFSPQTLKQEDLGLLLDNIKPDRTDLDLLFGCMLDWGVQLSMPMSQETIDGCTIYTVNEGDLVACFNEQISQNVIKAIADKAPLKIIFRDNCFGQDDAKINIYESFKQLMDWSDDEVFKNIKVI